MSSRKEGTSLLEALVALGLFALCVLLLLALHEGARRTIRLARERAERQRAARVALDRIRTELWAIGSHVDAGEAIEGAWAEALVVRGAREAIVGYFLAEDDGSSPDTLRFDADGEVVAVRDLSVGQERPPYTLYRLVIGREPTAIRREPVIDGVDSLRFAYRDRSGGIVQAPGGSDDADARRARGEIRGVRVELSVSRGSPAVAELSPRNLRGVSR